MSLGCANLVPVAALKPGDKAIDLGCGGGIDCLLADREMRGQGLVVGVDVLLPLLRRARQNARLAGARGIRFVVADVRELPFPSGVFDVAFSNNAFNLLESRLPALCEAYRVLRCGGRLVLADTVATGRVARGDAKAELDAWAGLPTVEEYERLLPQAGFTALAFQLGPVQRQSGAVQARPLLVTGRKLPVGRRAPSGRGQGRPELSLVGRRDTRPPGDSFGSHSEAREFGPPSRSSSGSSVPQG